MFYCRCPPSTVFPKYRSLVVLNEWSCRTRTGVSQRLPSSKTKRPDFSLDHVIVKTGYFTQHAMMPTAFLSHRTLTRPLNLGLALLTFSFLPTVFSDNAPPQGFRGLFDGETLKGWKMMPRLPVPRYPGAPFNMDPNGARMKEMSKNVGKWTVVDGAIVGEQDPPASGVGAYLVSEETFGDFELMIDMKPDWRTDTGFLIRTLPGGSPGLQVLCDFRPQGGIGGFYGNGLAGIHGMSFAIDAIVDEDSVPIRVISADPNKGRAELRDETRAILTYAVDVEEFLKVWKVGEFNTFKVRCEGRIPTVTTWVNGLKIAVLDLADIEWPNYDAEAIAEMTGGRGHISLEVHSNGRKDPQGLERWWPGAQVRWKNIYIKEL